MIRIRPSAEVSPQALIGDDTHLLSCVQENRQPLVSGAEALRVLELADRVESSALTQTTP